MQSIKRTAHRLTLKSYPWLSWLGGSLCAGMGLALLAIPKPVTQFTCARNQGTCQLSTSGLGHQQQQTMVIGDLKKAQLEVPATVQPARQRTQGSSANDAYAVVLYAQQESFVFSHLSQLGQPEQERVVRQINDFIQNPQIGSLAIDQKSSPGLYLFAAFWLALGATIALSGSRNQVCFDRPSGVVKVVCHRFLQEQTYTCQLQHIVEVRLHRAIQRPTSPHRIEKDDYGLAAHPDRGDYFVYRISLILSDGSELPLTAKFMPDLSGGAKIGYLVSEIQQFLRGISLLTEAHGVRIDEILQNS